jgi:hypothetical protein
MAEVALNSGNSGSCEMSWIPVYADAHAPAAGESRCISTLHWPDCPRNGRRREKTLGLDAAERRYRNDLRLRFRGVLALLMRMRVPNGQVSQDLKVKSQHFRRSPLGHADPRTTRLYDRRQKQVTRNTVERISI